MSKCCVCVAKATRKSQSPYKASHPAPGTRERRKRTQHSQGFSPNKILPLVGGWCCWHGGTQRGQAVCMQVLHYQPALHPHFQLDLVSIPPPGYCTGLYKQRDTSTDWWKNLLHQKSHKWKCLSEEKEGKMNSIRENSFPSTQWSPHTYQLMARHRFFKLAIICSPNFNKFVSSWKRTCQLRDMQHWWPSGGKGYVSHAPAKGRQTSLSMQTQVCKAVWNWWRTVSYTPLSVQQLRLHKLPGMHSLQLL